MGPMRLRLSVVFIALLMTMSLASCGDSGTKEAANNEPRIGEVGVPIKAGNNLELTVHGAEQYTNPNKNITPSPGNYFLALDLEIVNNGKEAEEIESFTRMKIKDSGGQKYGIADVKDITLSGKDPALPMGELQAGSRVRGYVVFEISQTARGLTFEFDPEQGNTAMIPLD